MKTFVLFVLILVKCLARPQFVQQSVPPIETFTIGNQLRVTLWPQPQSITQATKNTSAVIPLWRSFLFKVIHAQTQIEQEILNDAVKRYQEIIFYKDIPQSLPTICFGKIICINQVTIDVKSTSSDVKLEFQSDESYTISIDTTTVAITSQTVWGALHAMETLSQMIQISTSIGEVPIYAFVGYQVPLTINDAPRFKWRGILVDTSRHYYTVAKMLHIIDSMSYIKLNVLHWHIVDSQSFPVVIPGYPNLSSKGAYAPSAVYTPDDVQKIINYAFNRGIRIVFEFDMPGHSAVWGAGYPNIIANCPGIEPILNPAVEETFTVIDGVFAHIRSLAKDAYFHIGGDEIATDCWKQDTTIQQWMQKQKYKTVDEVLAYFERRVLDLLKKHKFAANVWEEVLTRYNQTVVQLPKDTVVTAWTGTGVLPVIVKAGYPAILSAGWYLDQQRPNGASHYGWVDTWKTFYKNEPYAIANFTEQEKKLLLGGEACMWSEAVDDANFDSRVFPRVLAVAERLWSPQDVTIIDSLTYARLNHHRCNMVRRGVMGGPVSPGYCDAVYGKKMSWQQV
jgi:hexosaminidase